MINFHIEVKWIKTTNLFNNVYYSGCFLFEIEVINNYILISGYF